jgi:hypothetical protein
MNNAKRNTTQSFIAILLLLLLSISLAACGSTDTESGYVPSAEDVDAAAAWLVAAQNDDGGFGSDFETGEPASSVSMTLDALLALSGTDSDVSAQLAYLEANSAEMSEFVSFSGGAAGKAVLALIASGADVNDFAGGDWVAQIDGHEADGSYALDAFNQALAILGLTAAGESVPDSALQALRDMQADDGSWDDGFGTLQNADATAMAIMGLLAGGAAVDDATIESAKSFLGIAQLPGGGWEYGAGFGENANSTGAVIQSLLALGEDFYSAESTWSVDGNTPLSALNGYQSETGAFQFFEADDLFATVQALSALSGNTYADIAIEGAQ